MKLIFEKSVAGRRCAILPACDVPKVELPAALKREAAPMLPEMSEVDVSITTPNSTSTFTASTAASIPWAPAP